MNKIWYGEIYKIENLVNGKVYIGQTTIGFNKRYGTTENNKKDPIQIVYNYHKNKIEYGCNIHLLRSIEKYGFESFRVNKIIDVAFSQEELDIKECMYIKLYNSINNGYNHKEGGIDGKRKVNQWKRFVTACNTHSFVKFNNEVYLNSSSVFRLNKNIKISNKDILKIKYPYINKDTLELTDSVEYILKYYDVSIDDIDSKKYKNIYNYGYKQCKKVNSLTKKEYLYIRNKMLDNNVEIPYERIRIN